MTKEIEVDDDVLEGLKMLAEPFVDTPNTVIKRLLEEKGILKGQGGLISEAQRYTEQHKTIERTRAKRGEVTPQSTYEEWLLETLWADFKGHAPKAEVTEIIIAKMEEAEILKEIDYETVSSGETRAANTIAWARNKLKEDGLIKNDSPRGIWELTEQGIEEAIELLGKVDC
jgi:predicted CopG family antitoxin